MKQNIKTRRSFLKQVTLGMSAFTMMPFLNTCSNSVKPKPNIIYILADDLGYGDLGCYGQKKIHTPNIDKLANQGMRFTQHYAGSTVCAPSRCSLMTGLHTGHTYVRGNKATKPMGQLPLPENTSTVAKLLKSAGYSTALIGKWGLGGPESSGTPKKQGFDYFYGYLCQSHAHNYYPEFLFRNDERVLLKGNKIDNPRPNGSGVASKRGQYSHDLIADEALQFVNKNADNPFFLYLALTIPHANNEARGKGMEVPDYGEYKNKDWPDPQKGYAAMISRMDKDVGRMMKQLKDLGILDNTLVIFTSDNGPHREGGADPEFFDSNGQLRGIKRDLYEGGIRVPMIAHWSGKIKPGSVTNHISAFWDFLPTACDISGVNTPPYIDGISFLSTMLGNTAEQTKHEYLYWEFHEAKYTKQAVLYNNWKLVKHDSSKPAELYNLDNDIEEKHDISLKYPEILEKVEKMFNNRTDSEHFEFRKSNVISSG